MDNKVYEPPSSDLTVPFDKVDHLLRAKKFVLHAYLIAPVFSSLVLVTIAFFVDGMPKAGFKLAGEIFLNCLVVTYVITFIFGLPIHWILGRFDMRKLYIYLGIGLVIPAPVVLLTSSASSLTAWITASGIGATWSIAFWFIAVYLYERNPSNKRMQGDQPTASA